MKIFCGISNSRFGDSNTCNWGSQEDGEPLENIMLVDSLPAQRDVLYNACGIK